MCEQNGFHAQKLLRHISRYCYDDYLCDTIIVTDDGRLSAHSIVLAAACPVFKAALQSTDQPREHVIMIPGVKSAVMKTILQFMYTGEIVPVPTDFSTVLAVMLELELVRLQPSKYVTLVHGQWVTIFLQQIVSNPLAQFVKFCGTPTVV